VLSSRFAFVCEHIKHTIPATIAIESNTPPPTAHPTTMPRFDAPLVCVTGIVLLNASLTESLINGVKIVVVPNGGSVSSTGDIDDAKLSPRRAPFVGSEIVGLAVVVTVVCKCAAGVDAIVVVVLDEIAPIFVVVVVDAQPCMHLHFALTDGQFD